MTRGVIMPQANLLHANEKVTLVIKRSCTVVLHILDFFGTVISLTLLQIDGKILLVTLILIFICYSLIGLLGNHQSSVTSNITC